MAEELFHGRTIFSSEALFEHGRALEPMDPSKSMAFAPPERNEELLRDWL